MHESFLHFLWRTRRFYTTDLTTTEGQPIDLLDFGEFNTHAGPDFFNARLRLGDTLWAGNIEMHVRSSDWLLHGHSEDKAYDNVVLHVVLEEDTPIFRSTGERLPCLELKERIPERLLQGYRQLEASEAWIPCEAFFPNIPLFIKKNWLDRLLVERLEQKTEMVQAYLMATNQHWEEAFYRAMARNFGLKVNAEPFETLARNLPLTILARHKDSLLQLEALLLGQAGLLETKTFKEEWPRLLQREYRHLAHKYGLQPQPAHSWKFLRMRPANFPTLRLAQFAALMHQSAQIFSILMDSNHLREIEHFFEVQTSPYWEAHFLLDKPSRKTSKKLGKDFIQLLVVNTVVPFLFYYGKVKGSTLHQQRALRLLEELPAEHNSLLEGWRALGLHPKQAHEAQALIHLKNQYCAQRRCMECAIGASILK